MEPAPVLWRPILEMGLGAAATLALIYLALQIPAMQREAIRETLSEMRAIRRELAHISTSIEIWMARHGIQIRHTDKHEEEEWTAKRSS